MVLDKRQRKEGGAGQTLQNLVLHHPLCRDGREGLYGLHENGEIGSSQKKGKKTKTTRSTSGWMRGCGDSCQTLGFKPWQFMCTLAGVFSGLFSRQPPEGIVRSAYVRKAKRTITPQWASVLPGWATRSVFPRPPAARCPGSLHTAGGTSQGKLLPWWREKRVISFCFIRGWRKK